MASYRSRIFALEGKAVLVVRSQLFILPSNAPVSLDYGECLRVLKWLSLNKMDKEIWNFFFRCPNLSYRQITWVGQSLDFENHYLRKSLTESHHPDQFQLDLACSSRRLGSSILSLSASCLLFVFKSIARWSQIVLTLLALFCLYLECLLA